MYIYMYTYTYTYTYTYIHTHTYVYISAIYVQVGLIPWSQFMCKLYDPYYLCDLGVYDMYAYSSISCA